MDWPSVRVGSTTWVDALLPFLRMPAIQPFGGFVMRAWLSGTSIRAAEP